MDNLPQAVEKPDAEETRKEQYRLAIEQIDIATGRLPTEAEQANLHRMAHAARGFISEVCLHIPDGKEREIAINNTISSLLWARQGIVRGRVEMVKLT